MKPPVLVSVVVIFFYSIEMLANLPALSFGCAAPNINCGAVPEERVPNPTGDVGDARTPKPIGAACSGRVPNATGAAGDVRVPNVIGAAGDVRVLESIGDAEVTCVACAIPRPRRCMSLATVAAGGGAGLPNPRRLGAVVKGLR